MSNYYGGWPISQAAQDYASAWYGNGGSEPLDNGQWQVNNLRLTAAGEALKKYNYDNQQAYRDLYQNDVRNQALRRQNQIMGTKDQNSLAALYDASILANDNFQVQNGGQYGFAAGNQANAQLDEMEGRGTYIDDRLRQAATDQDFLWNLDGDPNGLKGVGSLKYNSMGVAGGTHTGNNSPFAYGASAFDDNGWWNQHSGANHFEFDNLGYNKQQLDEIKRGWANNNRYSKDPMGSYGGPAGDGKNIHQYGDPRQNTGSNNNYQWQPPFLWPKDGYGDIQTNRSTGDGSYRYDDYSKYGAKQSKIDMNDSQYIDKSGYLKPPTADDLMKRGMGQGYTQPAYPALAQISDPPQVKSGPAPIMGSGFSPLNPAYDVFNQSLVGKGTPQPATTTYGDSAFSRYKTDPFTAGRINVRMSNYSLR